MATSRERNERGVPVAKVIYRLGREDLVDRDGLVRLVGSIERFLGVEPGLRAGAPRGFDFVAAPECGGPHVIGELWSALGMDKAIARVAGAGRGRCGLERAIFRWSATWLSSRPPSWRPRAGSDVTPSSPGTPALTDDQLSHAMDRLVACAERAQESVFSGVAHLLDLEVDAVFFGITSTWKIESDDDLDTDEDPQGPDERPKVQVGPAVTREGIPVRVWVWPASTSDQAVVEEMEADLVGRGVGRAIPVVDFGLSVQDSLRRLRAAGGHYIAGMKMRAGMTETDAALSRPGRHRTIHGNLGGAPRRRSSGGRLPRGRCAARAARGRAGPLRGRGR